MQERIPEIGLNIAWQYISQFQKASWEQQAQDLLHHIHKIEQPEGRHRSYIVLDPDRVEHRGIQQHEQEIIVGSDVDGDNNLMHNDLTRYNVVVSDDRILGVVDWGVAG